MLRAEGSLVLERVRILDPVRGWDQRGDVWIEAGILRGLGRWDEDLPTDVPRVHGESWVVGPGLIDLYAHSGEPGFEQRETFASLSRAALAGGFTQVGVLPSTHPPLDSLSDLMALHSRIQKITGPHFQALASVTQMAQGKTLTELGELSQTGITAFCADHPSPALSLLHRILEALQGLKTPFFLWPWSREIAAEGAIYEGQWALRLGLPGIPRTAETGIVAQVLELIRRLPLPLHLMRITQERSLNLIALAQQEGLPVTASSTWIHLILAEQDIQAWGYDPNLKVQPPLASSSDREALIQGLKSGVLTAIATDHAPYTFEEKAVPFGEAPAGGIGLELALPLLWSHLVEPQHLSALELWSRLSLGPAQCWHRSAPTLTIGDPANLVVFDPTHPWIVNADSICSYSSATPWWGQQIQGKVLRCWIPRDDRVYTMGSSDHFPDLVETGS